MPSRQDKNCESHFWPNVMTRNGVYHLYPSAKSRRELKMKTLGVIFRGASAYYVQKSIAPQKQCLHFDTWATSLPTSPGTGGQPQTTLVQKIANI